MSQKILDKLDKIEDEAQSVIQEVKNLDDLEKQRIENLGRKSELVKILRSIKDVDPDKRDDIGKKANYVKNKLEETIQTQRKKLVELKLEKEIDEDWIDVTVPPKKLNIGHLHPITQMQQLTENIFTRMGFDIEYPYEIDSEFHNFDAVNIPKNHPARDMWDTFWIEGDNVAITHTSSMQHRIIKSKETPIRTIIPGKCFRNEATDARHEHTFYQVEGIYVDRGITMNNMLGTLKAFFDEFFGQNTNILFTPDFFPFVEPGGMVSIDCSNLSEGFKKVSKGTGWLEVLGCGMIHPKVLEMAGKDPEVYSGFAWGVGLERLIMLKYDIDDIRLFHSGDLRFIRQF
ncbi:phenylalanine--tRNA ligase subunit alpha [Candidatus Dojkabacteria bacterium]|nr:phenylalanine--tRNA ligase subunit alpha [Candidatus Dojkabacteria bacterium]